MTSLLKRAAVFVLCASGTMAVFSCTVFNDVPPPLTPDGGRGRSPGLLSLEDAVRVCSLAGSCLAVDNLIEGELRLPIFGGYSYCVTHLATTFEPERAGREVVVPALQRIASLGPSGSCTDAQREFELDPRGAGDSTYPASLCTGGGERCLDGKTALRCNFNDEAVYINHCDRPPNSPSGQCLTYNGGVQCGTSLNCTDDDYACVGDVLQECYSLPNGAGSYRRQFDCRAIGMKCVKDSFALGCSTDRRLRTDTSNRWVFCDGTQQITASSIFSGSVDCAEFGGRCLSNSGSEGGTAVCVLDTDECNPFSSDIDLCTSATTISLCVGGKRTSFDCASIGAVCTQESGALAACKVP